MPTRKRGTVNISEETLPPCEMTMSLQAEDTVLIQLSGDCRIRNSLPSSGEVERYLASQHKISRLVFDTTDLNDWDSGLLTFLKSIIETCAKKGIPADRDGLPPGVQRLLTLAAAVPEIEGAARQPVYSSYLELLGSAAIDFRDSASDLVDFIGEAFLSIIKVLGGKSHFRRSEFLLIIQQTGAQALPIVSLISLLVGMILAFVGAIQLRQFGAQIFIADLVGIGIVREMGAIMTGVIMAGRTGASFAAHLGTMQVNDEIDALRTLGISPMEFLVLPRIFALTLMMPLLTLYADLMGILGGSIVCAGMLDVNFMAYFNQTQSAVSLNDLWIGLFMGGVFGILVALAGCLRGIQCGRSASDVGNATTSAVVTGIVSIVVATAIITVICDVIGI